LARNNNKFKFDIPVYIIVLAYILYWPVGIVLTVLRSISDSSDKSSSSEREKERVSSSASHAKSNVSAGKNKKRRSSSAVKLMTAGGIASAVTAVLGAVSAASGGDFAAAAGSGIALLAIAAVFLIGAQIFRKRDERFARIRSIIGNRSSLNLSKLASACDESLKRIRRDVQKLIDSGEYGDEAYIDLGLNNFMRNSFVEPDEPEAFDYRTVYGKLFRDEKGTDAKNDSGSSKNESTETGEGETDDFGRIIREIRRLNDDIKDVAVSYRIEQIEEHTKNIFEYVTAHPEAMPQIRTFMNYYLPTTLKLLESYSRIERVGVAGENMKKSKDNIENTLDLLVIGFERQLDQLFRNESIDISSDISVLETMMKRDGLSSSKDFDISSYMDKYSDEIRDGYSDDLSAGGAAAMKNE